MSSQCKNKHLSKKESRVILDTLHKVHNKHLSMVEKTLERAGYCATEFHGILSTFSTEILPSIIEYIADANAENLNKEEIINLIFGQTIKNLGMEYRQIVEDRREAPLH